MHRYSDPITGRNVSRITPLETHSHHPYFYNRCFTPDSRHALTISRTRDVAHIHLIDVETGEAHPLVSGKDIEEYLVTLTPDGQYLYYSQGPLLHRVHLQSGEDDVLWEQRPPWDGSVVYPGFSADYRSVLFAQMHRDDALPQSGGWERFEPQFRARPRCRLVLFNLETGTTHCVHEEACWLGHPQICPGDPDTLMFCHEGPARRIDARVWLIQADGSNMRCMGYRETEDGAGAPVVITHECFTPDGKHIVYILIPAVDTEKTKVRLRAVADFSLVRDFPVSRYLHASPSPDGRFLAGDERCAEREKALIWMLDMASGVETPLCVHGSSFAPRGFFTQDSHPHPAFSPDGNKILFSSDREQGPDGHCAVYIVDRADSSQRPSRKR